MAETFDYIIVGGGSAGCVLANRLTEDAGARVLLLEAGPKSGGMQATIPAAWPKLFKSKVDWAYQAEAAPALNGRSLYWPRGKTLGGSSATNAMCFTRGNAADFDGWAADNPGWGWADVLPYFVRMEHFEPGPAPLRGQTGPMNVTYLRDRNPMSPAFEEAAHQWGIEANPDFNGERQDGVGPMQATQRGGRRWSAADAYLRPALGRPNLRVETGATVTRVVFERTRAVGVRYVHDGEERVARADREVILSGGAVNSPQLLMLSGVGPADELRRLGLDVVADLPGVGANLQDHPIAGLFFHITKPVSLYSAESLPNLARYLLGKRGPLTTNACEAAAFIRVADRSPAPDVELLFVPIPFQYEGLQKPDGHGFTIAVAALQPRSRGRITLRSADPLAAPVIAASYLSDPGGEDLRTMVEGFRIARAIAAQPALAPWVAGEFANSAAAQSDDELADVVRANVQSFYHPVGTCRMGRDEAAVVDHELRVRGVDGLRVVDASVMPVIPRGHTNAPTLMLAERAADLIRGRVRAAEGRARAVALG